MKPFDVRFRPGFGHAVYSGSANERETDFYSNHTKAQSRCDALNRDLKKAAQRTKRKCMCCPTEFQSEGIGNRLCASCSGKVGRLGKQWANA